MPTPKTFEGWKYICDLPNSTIHGQLCTVFKRNATDFTYWDAVAPDGGSPAIAESRLRELFNEGKLVPPEREVPYYTTDNETEHCGHVWRQRQSIGGPWGFQWSVIPPYGRGDEDAVAGGWRRTQAEAERAMNEALERAKAGNKQ